MFCSGTFVRSLRGSLGFRSGGARAYDIYDVRGPCSKDSCTEMWAKDARTRRSVVMCMATTLPTDAFVFGPMTKCTSSPSCRSEAKVSSPPIKRQVTCTDPVFRVGVEVGRHGEGRPPEASS